MVHGLRENESSRMIGLAILSRVSLSLVSGMLESSFLSSEVSYRIQESSPLSRSAPHDPCSAAAVSSISAVIRSHGGDGCLR